MLSTTTPSNVATVYEFPNEIQDCEDEDSLNFRMTPFLITLFGSENSTAISSELLVWLPVPDKPEHEYKPDFFLTHESLYERREDTYAQGKQLPSRRCGVPLPELLECVDGIIEGKAKILSLLSLLEQISRCFSWCNL